MSDKPVAKDMWRDVPARLESWVDMSIQVTTDSLSRNNVCRNTILKYTSTYTLPNAMLLYKNAK